MDAARANTPTPPTSAALSRTAAGAPALLLACGNSLRQDDGVGLRIAEAAEQFIPASRLRIVAAQQFTPEMAADLAATDLVIFVDACAADDPGAIRVCPVAASADAVETHRLDPPALLAMASSLCGHTPAHAFALTVGAGRFGYGTEIAGPVRQAIPRACRLVTNLLSAFSRTQA
jgi:hydrogenase maturation protease